MAQDESAQGRPDEREEAEAMASLQEEINSLPVSEHLVFMLRSLSSLAVDRLGLVPEAASRRDPAQARLGIEAFKALLAVLEPERPAEEISAYRSMLSQLQMAYVGALSAGTAPAKPEAPGEETTEPTAKQDASVVHTEPKATEAKSAEPAEAPKKAANPRAAAKGGAGAAGSKGATKGS